MRICRDLGLSNLFGDIKTVDRYLHTAATGIKLKPRFIKHFEQSVFVGQIHTCLHSSQSHSPVHRAGIQIGCYELLGKLSVYSAFTTGGRSVN